MLKNLSLFVIFQLLAASAKFDSLEERNKVIWSWDIHGISHCQFSFANLSRMLSFLGMSFKSHPNLT